MVLPLRDMLDNDTKDSFIDVVNRITPLTDNDAYIPST